MGLKLLFMREGGFPLGCSLLGGWLFVSSELRQLFQSVSEAQ